VRRGQPGYSISPSHDPGIVIERSETLDYARYRAARLTRDDTRWDGTRVLVVWNWNPDNGLRKTRAVAEAGLVHWMVPCPSCAERGCVACDDLGAVRDPRNPPERPGDAL
jgi:hypothetical protein